MANSDTVVRQGSRATRGDRIHIAYDRLRELIVEGRLAPGSRVIESDVAERLKISRTPVRSALHRLQQEGYITASGRGRQLRLTIAPLTQEDARELFSIVGEVEGLAARRAASLPAAQRSQLAQELTRINEAFQSSVRVERPDRERVFELDTTFHRTYVEAGAGARLLALHDSVKPQAERYIRLYINTLVEEIGLSVQEHALTIASIQVGDEDAAHRAVRTNWWNAADRLSAVIQLVGERGSW